MCPRSHKLWNSLLSVAAATAFVLGGGTLAGIASGTVPAAFAQDQPAAAPGGSAHEGGHRMGKILMQLNLSDDQKSQIRSIMADARKANAGVTDPDAKRANMKAAFAKVDGVLTPDQRAQFKSKMEAMRKQQGAPQQSPQ